MLGANPRSSELCIKINNKMENIEHLFAKQQLPNPHKRPRFHVEPDWFEALKQKGDADLKQILSRKILDVPSTKNISESVIKKLILRGENKKVRKPVSRQSTDSEVDHTKAIYEE